jgi:hypothetical protein
MNYATFSRALLALLICAGIKTSLERFVTASSVAGASKWHADKGKVWSEDSVSNPQNPCSYPKLRHSGHIYPFP